LRICFTAVREGYGRGGGGGEEVEEK